MRCSWCGFCGWLALIVVTGIAASASAADPMIIEEPLLVPKDWQAAADGDTATTVDFKLIDSTLLDPFHGRDAVRDPWAASSAKTQRGSCDCACGDVIIPADWR